MEPRQARGRAPAAVASPGVSTEPQDWNAVLDRLLAGEPAAFLHFNRLVTGCLLQLRAYDFEQEWDDLRQEVLAAVVQSARAGRLREREAFVAYVRAITRNKLMDRIKRRLRRQEGQTLPWEEATAGAAEAEPAPGPEPELRRDLQDALAELPDEERRLVVGVYVEGRTYPEMADRSGVPLGTLKRRLRDGLARLRARLGETRPGGPDPPARETHGP